jgi:hypothetical protein
MLWKCLSINLPVASKDAEQTDVLTATSQNPIRRNKSLLDFQAIFTVDSVWPRLQHTITDEPYSYTINQLHILLIRDVDFEDSTYLIRDADKRLFNKILRWIKEEKK